jgi:hypothetical protein
MPAIANWGSTTLPIIAETNSAALGVDRTFAPERFLDGGVARYVDRTGGIPLGFPWITFSMRPPSKDNGLYKLSVKLGNPVLETIDPSVGIFGPKLAYELQAHLDVLIPARATAVERQKFLAQLGGLMVSNIKANDAAPNDVTGSPLVLACLNLETVF